MVLLTQAESAGVAESLVPLVFFFFLVSTITNYNSFFTFNYFSNKSNQTLDQMEDCHKIIDHIKLDAQTR